MTVTHPPEVDVMGDELAEAVTDRRGWNLARPPSACSVRADYRHGNWSCVIVGNLGGWHWSAWSGIHRVRDIYEPAAANAADAVRQVEELVCREGS
jgi:hypothetical protein